jgi:DtxR family Mn-dependent transcriptional regulator
MVNPVLTLLLATAILLILAFIFWPDKGLIARWRWSREAGKKELIEDALKHIYNCEEKNITCTLTSLAGAIFTDPNEVTRVMSRLESLGLLSFDTEGFELTARGKDYALRIIRIHRLWERYLAEETSVPETLWHEEADIQEHRFSEEEANAISRRLGYPRYDPHGDPIPTSSGDLPPQKGRPLSSFLKGDLIQVIHIEDEPPAIYAQIINMGIYLGIQLEILKKTKNQIELYVNGVAQTISALQVRNITATLASEKMKIDVPLSKLSSLKNGERAEVITISRACRGAQRRRLMDLGIIPGTVVSLEMTSAGGDPKAYNIRGAVIALRKTQTDFVQIQPLKEAV